MKADTTVPDGYTVVLVNPVDEKSELAEKPGTSELHYVVLLTPSVLDSTGKRLHSDVEIEALCR